MESFNLANYNTRIINIIQANSNKFNKLMNINSISMVITYFLVENLTTIVIPIEVKKLLSLGLFIWLSSSWGDINVYHRLENMEYAFGSISNIDKLNIINCQHITNFMHNNRDSFSVFKRLVSKN